MAQRDWDMDEAIPAVPAAVAATPGGGSMTSPLKTTVYRPAGRLALYVRAFQVLSTTDPPTGVSVLDFGGGDVSVPVSFGDPVLVEDWEMRRCGPRPWSGRAGTLRGCGSRAGSTR
jgi:hypothetical protein